MGSTHSSTLDPAQCLWVGHVLSEFRRGLQHDDCNTYLHHLCRIKQDETRVKRRREWTLGNSNSIVRPLQPAITYLLFASSYRRRNRTFSANWLWLLVPNWREEQSRMVMRRLRPGKYGRLSRDTAEKSPPVTELAVRTASHRIARKLVRRQKRFPSCRPREEPQMQTSVTPRREAEGPRMSSRSRKRLGARSSHRGTEDSWSGGNRDSQHTGKAILGGTVGWRGG